MRHWSSFAHRSMFPVPASLTATAAVLMTAGSCFGQAFIENVFPPSVLRGETTRVELRGSELDGAVALWLSVPDGRLTAKLVEDSKPQSAAFEISAAADAPLGVYGLRLATEDGLSNVHLFAIDDLPMFPEDEQPGEDENNKPAVAEVVQLPAAIAGVCHAGDVDIYAIDVKAGQRVSFEVVGNRFGKDLDPWIVVVDDQGNYVADRDNDSGLFFDCRFQHTFKQSGRYFVQVRDSRYKGSVHWSYLLRLGRFPVARLALPSAARPGERSEVLFPQLPDNSRQGIQFPKLTGAKRFYFGLRGQGDDASAWLPLAVSSLENQHEKEPNDEPEAATVVSVPGNAYGIIDKANDWDHFAVELKKGQRIHIRTDTRDMGSAADLEMTIIGPDGKTLKQVDDSGFDDPTFDFSAPADGRFLIKVLDVVRKGGPEYAYRIELRLHEPAIGLTSEVGRIAIPQGTWQPLPLALQRTDYNGPVQLELTGAPEGMRLRTPEIGADVNQLVNALEVDPSVKPGVYSLQVFASATHNDRSLKAVASTHPLVDRKPTGRGPHGEPFELREDQRRLPPTLTDRLAVLVLPPAPFDFDPADLRVVMPRFGHREFVVKTTRRDGFDKPIRFVARGGQLEHNRLRKPGVESNIADGTVETAEPVGRLKSEVNSTVGAFRVTLTGTTQIETRTINLTRTFDLDVQVAFAPAPAVGKLTSPPGASVKVVVRANRVAPYDGAFQVAPSQIDGFTVAEEIEFAAGQDEVEVTIGVGADVKPGKYAIKFPGEAKIDQYAESAAGGSLEITVAAKAAEQEPADANKSDADKSDTDKSDTDKSDTDK
ncbi:MAG: PPC domain-containing protein [Pirellulaceae bacterium]|nr:PPC domain-containing protein [Pirellulaceae bacterium]